MRDESSTLGTTRLVSGWLLALAGPGVLTAVMLPHRDEPALGNEALLFLGLTVAVAPVGGRWPAVAAAAASAALLNFFFTPPLHTLAIQSGQDVLALAVFVVTALAVSAVVDAAASRLRQAEQARHEAETLAMLNRSVLGGELEVDALLAPGPHDVPGRGRRARERRDRSRAPARRGGRPGGKAAGAGGARAVPLARRSPDRIGLRVPPRRPHRARGDGSPGAGRARARGRQPHAYGVARCRVARPAHTARGDPGGGRHPSPCRPDSWQRATAKHCSTRSGRPRPGSRASSPTCST
ncbi:DUF4118 domain-containing protein [Nocardioides sp. B-3]|uniref:DUF4118 domain-containing protein n=1 Tax=Nocardioides sp. B-3 TaxID=2895565 RepID=UPI0021520886|nr:DUF4118 domain-containing protein [Nocardioides sp. B-3]UUZ58811.1 DUF4118 domain-containing protein [Nocardioides sp. B-3]